MKTIFLLIIVPLFLSACYDEEPPQPRYQPSDILVTKNQKERLLEIVDILSDEKPKIGYLVNAFSHSLMTTYAPSFADIVFSEADSMNLEIKDYVYRLLDHKDDLEIIAELNARAVEEINFKTPLIRKTFIDLDQESYLKTVKSITKTSAQFPVDLPSILKDINQLTVIEELPQEAVVKLLKNKLIIDL